MVLLKELKLSKNIDKKLLKDLYVHQKILIDKGGKYMSESKLSVIQENSVEIRFDIQFEDEEVNLSNYKVRFEVYETTVAGSNIKRFIKQSSETAQLVVSGNMIRVFIRPADTRVFDIQSCNYVYVLEALKNNPLYDSDDQITLDRGVFEVLPRIIS